MTFDVDQIERSKQAFRRRAAAQPIEQKLDMLDALRERTLLIRAAGQLDGNTNKPRPFGRKESARLSSMTMDLRLHGIVAAQRYPRLRLVQPFGLLGNAA